MGNEHKFNFNIWSKIVYPFGGIVAYAETVLCTVIVRMRMNNRNV